MSEDKQLAGPVLAAVGGLVILMYAAYELYIAANVSSVSSLNGFPVTDIGNVMITGWLGVVFGLVIIFLSIVLVANPANHTACGAAIISLAILSLVSLGGGNGVGFLLAVLGGTCGIVFGPDTPESRQNILSQ